MSFFTLPLEIREEVYQYALLSPHPIMVLKANTTFLNAALNDTLQYTSRFSFSAALEYEKSTTPIVHLAANLFCTHSLIAKEAAHLFYSQNTFAFFDGFYWMDVIQWLRIIGERNRGYLKNLCLNLEREPAGLYQFSMEDQEDDNQDLEKGTFTGYWAFTGNWSSRLLGLCLWPIPSIKERPWFLAAEKVDQLFQFLGQMGDFPKIIITILLGDGLAPGVYRYDDRENYDGHSSSKVLPIAIDKSHRLHTTREGKREVEVLWKGFMTKTDFENKLEWIKGMGWEVKAFEEEMMEEGTSYVGRDSLPRDFFRKTMSGFRLRELICVHFTLKPSSRGITEMGVLQI